MLKILKHESMAEIRSIHEKPGNRVEDTSSLPMKSSLERGKSWQEEDDEEIGQEPVEMRQLGSQKSLLSASTSAVYCLDFKQPDFRLFNNTVLAVANPEEAAEVLHAVAESLCIALQSHGKLLICTRSCFLPRQLIWLVITMSVADIIV